VCLAGSGEDGEPSYAGESFDERVGMGVGAGQAQVEPPTVAHDPGGHVEEGKAQPFAPAGGEGAGQGKGPDPPSDVVGGSALAECMSTTECRA